MAEDPATALLTAFSGIQRALEPILRRWMAALRQLGRQMVLIVAKLAGVPIRQGRPVWRAHTRKHWGQHG